MRNFLFILASTATLAIVDPAKAQMYLPPTNPSAAITPGYTAPSTTPGYNWREQRAMTIGVTTPFENSGLMKIHVIITGERNAQTKIGGSARIMKNKEHQIMRQIGDMLGNQQIEQQTIQ